MIRIEELVYRTHEYGKREILFDEISKIRLKNPNIKLEEVYDLAYQNIMKT